MEEVLYEWRQRLTGADPVLQIERRQSMKKCKNCDGTGLVLRKPGSIYMSWDNSRQLKGVVEKKETCPKCYGKGMR
jgi:DnaJ-class molecular chaperone